MKKSRSVTVMKPNNTDYIHHVVEAFRMSFGSSLVHVADPAQVDIPIEKLLSEEYTNKLSSPISPSKYESGVYTMIYIENYIEF